MCMIMKRKDLFPLVSQSALNRQVFLNGAIKKLERMIDLLPKDNIDYLDLPTYLREYRTIIAGGGRQNGKLHWVSTHSNEDSLILCVNKCVQSNFKSLFD